MTDWSTTSGTEPLVLLEHLVQFEVYRLVIGAVPTPKPTSSTDSGSGVAGDFFSIVLK